MEENKTLEKMKKPSGWKSREASTFFTKDSKYGVKYRCKYCGRESLGIAWGDREKKMHWRDCLYWAEKSEDGTKRNPMHETCEK